MSIYGDMLDFFPEQTITIPYFDMEALQNDNYGPRIYEMTTRGIVQTAKSSQEERNNNLVRESRYSWWTASGLLLGRFVQYDGITFRLKSDNDWPTQAGYFEYELEEVVGSNGSQSITPAWNTGSNSFG